jgi:hypothetical protein
MRAGDEGQFDADPDLQHLRYLAPGYYSATATLPDL